MNLRINQTEITEQSTRATGGTSTRPLNANETQQLLVNVAQSHGKKALTALPGVAADLAQLRAQAATAPAAVSGEAELQLRLQFLTGLAVGVGNLPPEQAARRARGFVALHQGESFPWAMASKGERTPLSDAQKRQLESIGRDLLGPGSSVGTEVKGMLGGRALAILSQDTESGFFKHQADWVGYLTDGDGSGRYQAFMSQSAPVVASTEDASTRRTRVRFLGGLAVGIGGLTDEQANRRAHAFAESYGEQSFPWALRTKGDETPLTPAQKKRLEGIGRDLLGSETAAKVGKEVTGMLGARALAIVSQATDSGYFKNQADWVGYLSDGMGSARYQAFMDK